MLDETRVIRALTVRVFFSDDTSTVIYVLEDDEIVDAIVEMCEREGYDMKEVEDYTILGKIEEEI